MKNRTCDKCHKIIPAGTRYYKITSQEYKDNICKSFHAGDLCQNCWGVKWDKNQRL